MKVKLRRMVLDGQTYLWSFTPGYVRDGDSTKCRDLFTTYLANRRESPLKVWFTTWEDPMIGGPLRVGVPLELGEAGAGLVGACYNLHTPHAAASIIRRARAEGWDPDRQVGPFIVDDGLRLLAATEQKSG